MPFIEAPKYQPTCLWDKHTKKHYHRDTRIHRNASTLISNEHTNSQTQRRANTQADQPKTKYRHTNNPHIHKHTITHRHTTRKKHTDTQTYAQAHAKTQPNGTKHNQT